MTGALAAEISAVMIAASRGARVIAVDVSPPALERAQALGAAAVVDATHTDVIAAVRELTGGGARVSLDTLGSVGTCQDSIRSLRRRGRHIQVGLMLGDDELPPVPMAEVIGGELEIVGSHGMAAHAYPPMLAEITSGTLRPEQLIARRIPLAEASDALAEIGRRPGDGITMVIPFDDPVLSTDPS